jgi:hypothetical protein
MEEADGRGAAGNGAGVRRPARGRKGRGAAGGRGWPDRWVPPVSERERERRGGGPCGPEVELGRGGKRKEGEVRWAAGWAGLFCFFLFFLLFFQILFQTNLFNTFKFKSFTQLSPIFPQLF